jgi:hypothetical protein
VSLSVRGRSLRRGRKVLGRAAASSVRSTRSSTRATDQQPRLSGRPLAVVRWASPVFGSPRWSRCRSFPAAGRRRFCAGGGRSGRPALRIGSSGLISATADIADGLPWRPRVEQGTKRSVAGGDRRRGGGSVAGRPPGARDVRRSALCAGRPPLLDLPGVSAGGCAGSLSVVGACCQVRCSSSGPLRESRGFPAGARGPLTRGRVVSTRERVGGSEWCRMVRLPRSPYSG